jgi:hypothetical protein
VSEGALESPASNAFFFESIGDELRVFVLCGRFAGTDEATAADIIDPEEETIYYASAGEPRE